MPSRPTDLPPCDVPLRILLTVSRTFRGILAFYTNLLDAKVSRFAGWASLKTLEVQRRFYPRTEKWCAPFGLARGRQGKWSRHLSSRSSLGQLSSSVSRLTIRPHPPPFFGSADSKRAMGVFFVSADSTGVSDAGRRTVTREM
jgi:hypothetical protein